MESGWAGTGVVFLDSVDELKITLRTLKEALAQLSKDLAGCLARARVIISSRPSDWHSGADRPTYPRIVPWTRTYPGRGDYN